MEVRVRAGGVGDVEGVIALERGVVEAPHWGAAEYAAIVDVDGGVRRCLMVAEKDGVLVGFAVGKVVAGVGEIESVAVDAAARRGGVGRALCEAVVEWSRGLGAEAVELEVRAGSGGAIALYGVLGFVSVGRRKGYYREPTEDALLMRLGLGGRGKPLDKWLCHC
jgi:ribosomal-protein-alanine N-acetyltransferase